VQQVRSIADVSHFEPRPRGARDSPPLDGEGSGVG
jgi:hypothetical protein